MIASTIINSVIQFLHADNLANLQGWTESELYGFLNRSMNDAAADSAILGRYGTIAITAGNSVVSLPATCAIVVQASWNFQTLKIRTVSEMDALDGNWMNAPGNSPDSLIVDQQGSNTARLYPTPDQNGTMRILSRCRPATLSSISSIAVPESVDVIAHMETIAEARRRAGMYGMPEAAAAAQQIANIVKAANRVYYGGSV